MSLPPGACTPTSPARRRSSATARLQSRRGWGRVDRVNGQLDKVDRVTDSAVDAVESVDTAIRAVSLAITRPVQKLTGLAAGVTFGAAEFKAHRDWRNAVQAGKDAAARREEEL